MTYCSAMLLSLRNLTRTFIGRGTFLCTLSLLLSGCQHPQNMLSDANNKAEKIEGEKVVLASFSDRLLLKSLHHQPIIDEKYIVDYCHSDLTIYDSLSLKVLKVFANMICDQAPTFMDQDTLMVASDHHLILIDLTTMESSMIANLDAPLLTAPYKIDDNHIFIQYMNNIAQCFDLHGHSLWKTLLPYSASYYKHTQYAPCVDHRSVYLAYPGGSLIKLNQKTGMIEWLAPVLSQKSTQGATDFSAEQINAPLKHTEHYIFAQTSKDQCVCIDPTTGHVMTTLALAPHSQSYMNDACFYAIDPQNILRCYALDSLKQLWTRALPASHTLVGQKNHDLAQLCIQDPQGKLLILDHTSGEILQTFAHNFKNYDLFAYNDNIYAFNSGGTLVKIQLPSSITD